MANLGASSLFGGGAAAVVAAGSHRATAGPRVLATRGNGDLSPVSVLAVLAANMADPPPAGSIGLMIAIGPAFCPESVSL